MSEGRRQQAIDLGVGRRSCSCAKRLTRNLIGVAIGRQRVLVDVLDLAHQCIAPRRRLREIDEAIMDLGEERAVLLAEQPQLRRAGAVRERA